MFCSDQKAECAHCVFWHYLRTQLLFNQIHAINSAIALLSPAARKESFPSVNPFYNTPCFWNVFRQTSKKWKLILPLVSSDLPFPQAQPQGNACLVQFQLCWNFQQQFLGRLSPTPLRTVCAHQHKHTQTVPSLYQPHSHWHPVSNKAEALTAAKGKRPNHHHIPLVNNMSASPE